jgi:N-acetylglucosamine-6-phosphate deacetylase
MEKGILPSAGHSDATYEELAPAVDAGCRLVTHLYSATSTVTRQLGYRHLGVIETAYLRDDMAVEIIADGHHLPPELIRLIVKIKGADRVAAVTDSLYPAGTDIKEGITDGVAFIVEDGVCRLPDRSAFAGSIATADRLLQVLHRDCGFSLPEAVKMLTAVPARIMGLEAGKIEAGLLADIVVLEEALTARHVFVGGEKVL